jgi:branched-chain amino acid transport system ATP-binding protein
MSVLEAKNVGITFGGLRAVNDFNLTLEQGELVAIIGPNGAGKTTSFNMLTGIYKPTDGDILIEGQSILKKQPHEISAES